MQELAREKCYNSRLSLKLIHAGSGDSVSVSGLHCLSGIELNYCQCVPCFMALDLRLPS